MALSGPVKAAILLGSLAALPAATPSEGWRAYGAGNVTDAVALWTEAAMAGDADAAYGLGVAYDLGRGVAQDESRACLWYGRAGAAGLPAAAFNTAVMLDQGRCGPRDAIRVASWYGRAVAFGHPRAAYDMAQLYEAGDGVPQNYVQAALLYRTAAAGGLSAAGDKAATLARLRVPAGTVIGAVTPLTPVEEIVPDRGQPIPFVWAVPAQPALTRFFLEVYALHEDGPREVIGRYVADPPGTALVSLQPGATQYAWRVLTVAADSHRYVAGEWTRFQAAGRTSE